MTVFLCVLAALALWSMPSNVKVTGSTSTVLVATVYLTYLVLTLGLATLALVSYLS